MNPFVVVDPALVPKETRVSEIFYSIQGEGKLAGTPSAFLRLSGCNLRLRLVRHPLRLLAP